MKYKNTKTGAIINSPCKISGGDWIEIKLAKSKGLEKKSYDSAENEIKDGKEADDDTVPENEEETEDEIVEEQTETDDSFDGITIKQIKQELDAFGIEYDPKAKKKVLYDLMMQGK